MSEFITRLYIDSRHRAVDSATPTDFSIDLRDNLNCAGDTAVHVRSASFPAAWWTLEPGRDKLAVRAWVPSANVAAATFLELQPGFHDGHSFADMLKERLNAWDMKPGFRAPEWDCLYVPEENRIVVQWGDEAEPARTWQFLSQTDLATIAFAWTGPPYNPQNPETVDDVLRMSAPGSTYTVTDNGTWVSGYYDSLAGIHELYLHSTLAQFKASGPRPGVDRDVLCRVPILVGHGEINAYEAHGHTYDFSPCYYASQKILTFRLTDYRGRVVDLHGGELSLELLFHARPT